MYICIEREIAVYDRERERKREGTYIGHRGLEGLRLALRVHESDDAEGAASHDRLLLHICCLFSLFAFVALCRYVFIGLYDYRCICCVPRPPLSWRVPCEGSSRPEARLCKVPCDLQLLLA